MTDVTLVRPIKRVLIVGATHGNELPGAWVKRRIEHEPEIASRPSIDIVQTDIGNPKAHAAICRFIEIDLNRQFKSADLANLDLGSYEHKRAKEINQLYGPKGEPTATDFMIDIHTTTASMGITLITGEYSHLGLAAAAWCKEKLKPLYEAGKIPEVHIHHEDYSKAACGYLCSVGREGLMIEIGPVPQGVLRQDACSWAELATSSVMDFLHAFNTCSVELPDRVCVQRDIGIIPVPTDANGLLTAMFHRDFQGRDYHELRTGDPMFATLDGKVIAYDGALGETVWPCFINEAAYYKSELGLGVGITKREEVRVPRLRVDATHMQAPDTSPSKRPKL